MRKTTRSGICALAAAGVLAVSMTSTPATAENADEYRAEYHFTVPDHWKNDPQRPILIDGTYHSYYLYNGDYDADPDANHGTEWRHATSRDGVRWADQGVAAPKDTNANYDLWSGSAVVDAENTAGFGEDAVVMLVTQMDHPTEAEKEDASGPQAQFLWYSLDDGYTFRPHGEQPVIPNGGREHFRDPKVVWDDERGRWVALIAEADRISFYTSPDLIDWTRRWEHVDQGIGMIECPDLFRIRADDGSLHWVLGVSANGYLTDDPATFAYWTGDFDGERFHFDHAEPRWLDNGYDWYGAVTWPDASAPLDRRLAVGWMNSWAYPHDTVTWPADGFNGTDSITRELRLVGGDDGYRLLSRPAPALDDHATRSVSLGDVEVDGHRVLDYSGAAYRFETTVSWQTAQNVGIQVRRSDDGSRHADIGATREYSYVNRGGTGHPGGDDTAESRAPLTAGEDVRLTVLVDRTSVELFVDGGQRVHSNQVFAPPEDVGLALYTVGGSATFRDVVVTEFAPMAPRPARVLNDFESESWGAGWTATGSFADAGTTASSFPGQVGERVADTFAGGGDTATGSITSPEFTIDRTRIRFLLAGGDGALGVEPATSVQLLLDGEPVRTATGRDDATLRAVEWDVSEYAGRAAQIQILDDATGDWGHLIVDHIVHMDGAE
ncbi:glycoside hydrolase family 32 protein [Microbacterium suaedae]|uniref:glycoside hydrolase family 32 protein n=1 Tax=Microbacterium suaedae TaxID=2067813 RepID=UPI000DA15065|nr:GH32 C-terminal domain-containing protein [Microbacterium suaedae]